MKKILDEISRICVQKIVSIQETASLYRSVAELWRTVADTSGSG